MSTEMPPTGRDPVIASRLQILSTEHWSLLATRNLTYTESLGRVNMFLGILSGAVIALALVAQADHFGTTFVVVAIFMLSVVLFAGVATVGRLMTLNRDDYRWVLGMNRIRAAYLEMHPELAPHFVTSPNDDLSGALTTLGFDTSASNRLGSLAHGLQTLPGMLAVIVSADAGAIAGLVAFGFHASLIVAFAAGAVGFLIAEVLMTIVGRRAVRGSSPGLEAHFPSSRS